MNDAPGRPEGLPRNYQWTGKKISLENHDGQADVYTMINRKDSRLVVIKIYKATDLEHFLRRVKSEIIALRRLNHQSKTFKKVRKSFHFEWLTVVFLKSISLS